jgi:hypothetical protein
MRHGGGHLYDSLVIDDEYIMVGCDRNFDRNRFVDFADIGRCSANRPGPTLKRATPSSKAL